MKHNCRLKLPLLCVPEWNPPGPLFESLNRSLETYLVYQNTPFTENIICIMHDDGELRNVNTVVLQHTVHNNTAYY